MWTFDPSARLWLGKPPMKETALQFTSYLKRDVMYVRSTCRLVLAGQLNWFHQCDNLTYQMFEFWTPDQSRIRAICDKISTGVGLPIQDRGPDSDFWQNHPLDSRMVEREDVFEFLDSTS